MNELWIEPSFAFKRRNRERGRFTKGHVPWNKGKKAWTTDDQAKRMIAMENFKLGQKSRHSRGGDYCAKPVICYDADGKYVALYKSITHASIATGIERRNIAFTCAGRRHLAGGYQWRLAEIIEWQGRRMVRKDDIPPAPAGSNRRYPKHRKTNHKQKRTQL